MAQETPFVMALRAFGRLAPAAREAIIESLEKAAPAISVSDLARSVGETVGKEVVDAHMLEEFLQQIAPLVPIVGANEKSAEGLAKMIAGWIEDDSKDTVTVAELQRLLLCENAIGVTAKAQDIMWGHGRVYREAHVITQIRPIFFNDLSRQPGAAVVVHELRVDFRESGRDESVCVALDFAKLKGLIDVLQRAVDKESSLRGHSRFNYLNLRGDNA